MSELDSSIDMLKTMTVKTNYFTSNQEELPIMGGNVPNFVLPGFCNTDGDTIEIYVHATPMFEVEDAVISIMKDGVVVALAKADDWEEPSSLSAFYRETASQGETNEFTVSISSRVNDVIIANGLQVAVK